MTRRRQVLLVVLGVLLVSQLPFAWRRYRLAELKKIVEALRTERVPLPAGDGYRDYRGVLHVHTDLGGHSSGRPRDVVLGAQKNRLDYVVMTEHPPDGGPQLPAPLRGTMGGVLFVGGNEVSTRDSSRLLIFPGSLASADPYAETLLEGIRRAKSEGKLAFVAYPEAEDNLSAPGYDGIEVFNLHTKSRQISRLLLAFDILWSYWSYDDVLGTRFYVRPQDNLRLVDALRADGRRLTAVAGLDAHSNIGFVLQTYAAQPLLGVKLDPYELVFQIARNYILLPREQALDERTVVTALAEGRVYMSFDLFADGSGFRFTASDETGQKPMGSEISLGTGVVLAVVSPLRSRIVLMRNGQPLHEQRNVSSMEFHAREPGVYRVEVYLDQIAPLCDYPWIVSNPIYVRGGTRIAAP